MDEIEVFRRFGLALAIGLLFGLERGWQARAAVEGARTAGVRTFALTALLGGVCGWLVQSVGPVPLAAGLLALTGLVALTYWVQARDGTGDRGLTTEIALLLSFGLGAGSLLGEMPAAAAVAVVSVALLASKRVLHGWIGQIRAIELDALVHLAVISVVVLPVLPREGYGPDGVLNPHELWWAVVLVAGLSFLGYAAMRVAGAQVGAVITGLFGGLASSTSTTLALARLVRGDASLAAGGAVGAVLAGSVTFLRVLVIATIFAPPLFGALVAPLSVMAVTGFAGAGLLLASVRGRRTVMTEAAGGNPLSLGTALSFGAVLVVVLLGTVYFQRWFGAQGIFVAAGLSGLTDVDALTISVARLSREDLAVTSAALAILLAVSVNSVVKAGIALAVGGPAFGTRVAAVYAAVLAAGGVAVLL